MQTLGKNKPILHIVSQNLVITGLQGLGSEEPHLRGTL